MFVRPIENQIIDIFCSSRMVTDLIKPVKQCGNSGFRTRPDTPYKKHAQNHLQRTVKMVIHHAIVETAV